MVPPHLLSKPICFFQPPSFHHPSHSQSQYNLRLHRLLCTILVAIFHLDMLICAPSTKEQRNHISISHTIRDRINAAYCGDIAFLFHSAMQVRRLKQNSRPTYTGHNRSAQQAADNDEYRTAVSRACASQSIATIGPTNITHVKKLYTPTVPTLGYPHPSTFQNHQTDDLSLDRPDP